MNPYLLLLILTIAVVALAVGYVFVVGIMFPLPDAPHPEIQWPLDHPSRTSDIERRTN